MKKNKNGLSRRDFLKGAAGITFISAAAAPIQCGGMKSKTDDQSDTPEPEKKTTEMTGEPENSSKVVLIRDRDLIDEGGKINRLKLETMLDEGLTKLVGESSADQAWKRLFSADDRVGIKSNVWRFLPTPPELEEALVKRLSGVGIPKKQIGIDDRKVLGNPLFQNTSALINVRPLRSHHWSGMGSLIKNYIMFHPNPPMWHDDSCAYLAGLWDLPLVKDKTRLNILVMITPQFHGKGPHHFQAKYTWPYKGLILSRDPVAADAVGVRILQAQRLAYFGKDEPFSVPPKHIEVAEKKFKLGMADPTRINLIKLGWNKDILNQPPPS